MRCIWRATKPARSAREVFAEVGEHFGMRAGEVAEVASFYSLFNQPKAEGRHPGLHRICPAASAARAVWCAKLEERLGIKSGTATADGRFAIAEVECLGSCGTAPVVQVNRNPYLERVTPDYLASLLTSPEAAIGARPPDSANLDDSRGRRWLSASAQRPAAPDRR